MTSEAIHINNLSFSIGKRAILTDINLTVGAKDFYVIIGPNGGGKSTLAKLIMGLLAPSRGHITLCGQAPKKGREQVGYYPQYSHVDLNYPISVLEVVLMGRLMGTLFFRPKAADFEAAHQALNTVGISHLHDRTISDLSGGERQRVFLARALVNKPKLLILDEPLSNVDIHAETSFLEVLASLNTHMAILMITHDLSFVAKAATKIGCLNKVFISHDTPKLHQEDLEATYGCDIDLIAHGVPHRVLGCHHD